MRSNDDFMQPGNGPLIEESVDLLEQLGDELTDDQCRRLARVAEQHITIRSDVPFDDPEDEDIEVGDELRSMVRALRGLRREIMTDDGQIREGKDGRDAKEIVQSTTQLLSLLLKSQEKLDHMERLRAIEDATTKVVREFDEENQARFFSLLEQALGEAAPAK